MNTEELPADRPGTRVLRFGYFMVACCVIVVAALAILVVLEIVPREALSEYAGKVMLVAAIIVVTGAAVAVLARLARSR